MLTLACQTTSGLQNTYEINTFVLLASIPRFQLMVASLLPADYVFDCKKRVSRMLGENTWLGHFPYPSAQVIHVAFRRDYAWHFLLL